MSDDAPKRKRDLPRAERIALARARREAEKARLFVTCAPGLEPWLVEEIRELGLGEPVQTVGGVELEGDRTTLYRANLELGLALQVRLRVGRVHAAHFTELVRRTAELPWERWLRVGERVRFRASAQRSRLMHTKAIEERVAEGIAKRLGGEVVRASGDEEVVMVHARLERDEATLSIDTSGAPLHRRGWRLASGKAPLREDLAHALLRISGWNRTSPLVDPMAGAGTIAIEAAALARGLAPGRLRNFAFEGMPTHDAALWQRVKDEAAARARDEAPPILARDRDEGAVAAARDNAERAGVVIEHAAAAISDPWPEPILSSSRGALVTNPPWGHRVSAGKNLLPLYQRLATVIDALPPAWNVGVVAVDPELVRRANLAVRSVVLTDAGGAKVRLHVRVDDELL
ncbi:MAG: class I SAM-dependent RNA methyltransferase [Sandaracinus sp.]|nr:class I SAM-dependent RNA methyltransferase [Sandaracinus sp.]MCB9617082.1 class I SAM-dependent RNA methyltransferase [Sandaracinus sp.]MCB9623593.1 class I SAM-dependent RNA methyltransferase [Sandaracinus sp.]